MRYVTLELGYLEGMPAIDSVARRRCQMRNVRSEIVQVVGPGQDECGSKSGRFTSVFGSAFFLTDPAIRWTCVGHDIFLHQNFILPIDFFSTRSSTSLF